MAHYISVLMPLSAGGWRALFPDIPDCEVEGESLDSTMLRAAGALSECVHTRYTDGPPSPRESPNCARYQITSANCRRSGRSEIGYVWYDR